MTVADQHVGLQTRGAVEPLYRANQAGDRNRQRGSIVRREEGLAVRLLVGVEVNGERGLHRAGRAGDIENKPVGMGSDLQAAGLGVGRDRRILLLGRGELVRKLLRREIMAVKRIAWIVKPLEQGLQAGPVAQGEGNRKVHRRIGGKTARERAVSIRCAAGKPHPGLGCASAGSWAEKREEKERCGDQETENQPPSLTTYCKQPESSKQPVHSVFMQNSCQVP